MWGRLVAEVRRAGWRKLAILLVAAAIAVALAYGDNSSNDAASGATLPRAAYAASGATLPRSAHAAIGATLPRAARAPAPLVPSAAARRP